MGKRILILAVFSVIMSVLLFGIWSNIHVYAQQQSSPPTRKASANSLNTTIKISSEKAKMCNPSNPSLKVVNATESRICGIPRTVKPHTAQPPTSSVSSSSSTPPYQQALTTKPTSVTMAPVSNPTNRSLGSSLSSSQSSIAPQVNAVNHPQQQERQQQTPITHNTLTANGDSSLMLKNSNPITEPDSHRIRSSSAAADSGSTIRKTSDISTDSTNSDTSSTDISTPTAKPSNHHQAKLSAAADNGSTWKKNKNADTTKIDTAPTTNRESASAIKNKVDSMIRNSIGGIINKTPFLLPFH